MTSLESALYLFRHDGILGTVVETGIRTTDATSAGHIDDTIVSTIRQLEATFSIFEPTSQLVAYRRTGHAADVDLAKVIDRAHIWWRRSGGAFHPAIEPLRQIWSQAEAANVAPSDQELAAAARALAAGIRHEHLNLNAIAKGWIVDRAVDAAMDHAPTSVWVSVGGDLVHRGIGAARVGLEDPLQPFDNIAPLTVVEVGNQALATSGNSRRTVRIAGRSYGEVLDPRTGMPVDHIASASVIAADAATADALATIAVILQPEESLAIVDEAAGASCLLVAADGETIMSNRWPAAIG